MRTDLVYRNPHASTDVYMAIEDVNVVAAIADAHSLEQAEYTSCTLSDGTVGSSAAPFLGSPYWMEFDGNLVAPNFYHARIFGL